MKAQAYETAKLTAVVDYKSVGHDNSVQYNGTEVPATFAVRLEHSDWPASALLFVAVDPTRGPVAAGLQAVNPSKDLLSYSEMHDVLVSTIDVRHLLRDVTAKAVGIRYRWREYEGSMDLPAEERTKVMEAAVADSVAIEEGAWAVARPQRRRIITKQYLDEVAATYRDALERGLPPTKHVQETYNTSHSNAARWVRMARESGALGAAVGTKPGEEQA